MILFRRSPTNVENLMTCAKYRSHSRPCFECFGHDDYVILSLALNVLVTTIISRIVSIFLFSVMISEVIKDEKYKIETLIYSVRLLQLYLISAIQIYR